jgi:hypothetical protein
MNGVGPSLEAGAMAVEIQRQLTTAKLAKQSVDEQGQMALTLIQGSTAAPLATSGNVGRTLHVVA